MPAQALTAIDLFAGVGGLSLGFEQAGFRIVFANEFDPQIAESYRYNHPNTRVSTDDIRKLDIQETFAPFRNKTTVVMGGPPCQGFSQKGQRKTINDERNFLFRNFVQVVDLVRPQFFVMENVPNLLTSESGLFKKELVELFEGLGYKVTADILNAADFGVPQLRKRAIVIGSLGTKTVQVSAQTNGRNTVWDAISDLSYLESGQGSTPAEYIYPPKSDLQKRLRKGAKLLHNHVATRHTRVALERLALIPPNCTTKVLPEHHRTKSIYSGTWTRLDSAATAPTITTRFDTPSSGQFSHPYLDRAITVREAARLQTFPDSFVFTGTKSSQMKQVGNAVPPLFALQIAQAILSELKGES